MGKGMGVVPPTTKTQTTKDRGVSTKKKLFCYMP